MNLQELSYLELYRHIYEEIRRKEEAQIKIRRWWSFIQVFNADTDIAIVRTLRTKTSFSFGLNSILHTDKRVVNITLFGIGSDVRIVYNNTLLIKLWLLKLILRAEYMFKIDNNEYAMGGRLSPGKCFQIIE